MKNIGLFHFMFLSSVLSACATIQNDGPGVGLGGAANSGGKVGAGGTIGAGNSASTGSTSSGTGSASTGSASSSGGGTSSGGASSGGTSSGGSSSGGAGTGGALTTGDCAGKPTYAAWSSTTGAVGDEVVIQCSKSQSLCTGLTLNSNYLWSCTNNVGNCKAQKPEDGSAWTLVRQCSE